MNDISDYVDRDGLIKPHADWIDSSGDGCITTAIAGLLGVYDADRCGRALVACIDKRTGCLMRRPDNSGPNQSHDGYVALAAWLLYTNDRTLARGLLVSGLMRLGYMNTLPIELGGLSWLDRLNARMAPWMGRFPKIWIALLAASTGNKAIRILCRVALTALTKLSPLRLDDSSGVQLKALDFIIIMMLSNPSPLHSFLATIRESGASICEVMAPVMYDVGHPTVDGYRALEIRILT